MLSARSGRGNPMQVLHELVQEIDELLFAEISERHRDRNLEQREDILSLLISVRFEDGGSISDRELRDQLVTLLLAGHETTATALAWTFDLLLHHPDDAQATHRRGARGHKDDYLRAVSPSRCVCAPSSRSQAGAWPWSSKPAG